MLRGATIICLSSIDWTFNWQIPQEIASRLVGPDRRVLFIENTGVRCPAPRDARRVGVRLRNWLAAGGRVRTTASGVDVFAPVILPFPYSRLACRLNEAALLRVIRRWMGPAPSPVILLTFLPTPLARALARSLEPALTVYYCADRLVESSRAARRLAGDEQRLLADADLVFTTSSGLQTMASEVSPRAVLLTSGVRYLDFERARDVGFEEPPGLADLRRPIAGYVGSLRNELDLALLARVARLAPDVSFVFVGPVVADVSRLEACPNVRLLGPVPHETAIRYMLRFDAGLLPYVVNAYTAHLMPVKLKEYLAAGLPVVSTGLPEVRKFVDDHGPVVHIADGAAAFAAALTAGLADKGPAATTRRLEIAHAYDWSGRMATVVDAIEAALEANAAGALAVRPAS